MSKKKFHVIVPYFNQVSMGLKNIIKKYMKLFQFEVHLTSIRKGG